MSAFPNLQTLTLIETGVSDALIGYIIGTSPRPLAKMAFHSPVRVPVRSRQVGIVLTRSSCSREPGLLPRARSFTRAAGTSSLQISRGRGLIIRSLAFVAMYQARSLRQEEDADGSGAPLPESVPDADTNRAHDTQGGRVHVGVQQRGLQPRTWEERVSHHVGRLFQEYVCRCMQSSTEVGETEGGMMETPHCE